MAQATPMSHVFDVDHEPVDAPPELFHAIRVPCACGRALVDCIYTFFPSSVFVHGTCADWVMADGSTRRGCGARSAIFAPNLEKTALEPMNERVRRSMRRLLVDLARVYGTNEHQVMEEFLSFIATAETPVQQMECVE